MGISFVAGQMLNSNLTRDSNLAFNTNTLYINYSGNSVGIGTASPSAKLEVVGNVLVGNVTISNIGTVSATANITGGNVLTDGVVSATGNVTGNYILGNGSQLTGLPAAYSNANVTSLLANFGSNTISTTGNITAGNTTSGNGVIGNLTFSTTIISTNLANGNINLTATGTGLVGVSGNAAVVIPTGNTAQRPAGNTLGAFRYNNSISQLEYNNGNAWIQIGAGGGGNATIIDQQITPDGTNATYALTQATTQASIFVTINGVAQLPSVAYTVSGNAITFTEVPNGADIIDIRFLAAAVTQNQIFNGSATTLVQTLDNGNILFTANTASAAVINASGLYVTGTMSATSNITGNYILGNGSQLTGLPAVYSNANVATYLTTYSGNLTAGNISVTGTIQSGNYSTVGNITSGNISATTHTGTTVSVSGNITSGNILTAGVVSTSGNVYAGNVINLGISSVTGNIIGGNLSVGNGTVTVGNIVTTGNVSGNIGNATNAFNTIFAKATTAQYADLAEMYAADQFYPPGTVLTIGGAEEVTISIQDADPRIAGIVSENPAYKMNSDLVVDYPVAVALTGRVKCLVQGTVIPGDMMVSAGNGRARAETNPAMGTVIGKALKASTKDLDIIEVIVGRL